MPQKQIKEIYLNENDSLNKLLSSLDMDISKINNSLLTTLESIFINNNNLIGYTKFTINKKRYNVYIFPKLIQFDFFPTEQQKLLYKNYLIDYYKLLTKYERINKTKLNFTKQCSINANKNWGDFFDSLLDNQYEYALTKLLKYIKLFHIKAHERKECYAQSISHPVDILKNVFEFDKSKIHQIEEIYNNSHIKIDYILSVINRFIEISETISNNKKLALNLKRVISNKFNINKVNYQNVLSNTIVNLFKKDEDIHTCLLILLGKESIFNDGLNANCNFIDNLEAIFFKPSEVFEYFVLNYLENKNNIEKIKYHPSYQYIIKDELNEEKINATPDFIIKNENGIDYLLDAKWKILENNKFPEIEDLIKLQKDSNVIKDLYKISINKHALIYPNHNNNVNRNLNINFLPNFRPEIIYIDVLRE